MARSGVTKKQVFEAADTLSQAGQAVTVANVREHIGSGSYTTITGHLAKWKESASARQPADVPSIPEPLSRLMAQLWAAAWGEAQAGLTTDREALAAARREMEKERREMESEIARLEAESCAQAAEIEKLRREVQENEKAARTASETGNGLRLENARLEERGKAAESRAAELKEELERLHAVFKQTTPKAKRPTRGRKSRAAPTP